MSIMPHDRIAIIRDEGHSEEEIIKIVKEVFKDNWQAGWITEKYLYIPNFIILKMELIKKW